jgi:hypothetical protein
MPTVYTPRGTVQPSALLLYAEGEAYADGHAYSAEGGVRRGATPRAAIGVSYAEGNALYADGNKPSAYSFIPVVFGETETGNCESCCVFRKRMLA